MANWGLSNSLNKEETFCVTLIRHPPLAGTTFPQGKASTRKREFPLFTKTMFCIGHQRRDRSPHTLAFPWGKVPTSSCGGRRMRVTLPTFDLFRQAEKTKL